MKYEKLRILSYDGDVKEEYSKRFNSYTTIKTNIRIHPFFREQRILDETFELFYLPLPSMLRKEEEIRYNSEKLKNLEANLDKIEKDIIERDHRDMTREISPLKQAGDAVLVDSSNMDIEQVVDYILTIIRTKKDNI